MCHDDVLYKFTFYLLTYLLLVQSKKIKSKENELLTAAKSHNIAFLVRCFQYRNCKQQ